MATPLFGSAAAALATPAAPPAAASGVVINEVESSGGTPGDWIELINNGAASVDLSGYLLKDDNDAHTFTIPNGTSIEPGGYYVANVAVDPANGFGLGSADEARLFSPGGTTLIDSYAWSQHASTTYGRCPNDTGDFATTSTPVKGAANVCDGEVAAESWPGGAQIQTADAAGVFGENLSGLSYQASGTAAPGVLWAVKNGPSTLYRLIFNGTNWLPDSANGWAAGKALHYPDGTGDPDSEGVNMTSAGRTAGCTSRPSAEWNLTSDLPPVGANLGLEAVSWIPDSYLTQHGFRDEHTGAAYDPSAYADHGGGLFFVGLEANGDIYAYALNQNGSGFTRVATISSGMPGVMDLQFDQETQSLLAVCDNTCNGQIETLAIAQDGDNAGVFAVTHAYARPAGMPNLNNEGFAIAPPAECVNGLKPAFWSDDTDDDSHALRSGTIDCTETVVPPVGGGIGDGETDGGGSGSGGAGSGGDAGSGGAASGGQSGGSAAAQPTG